MGLPVTIDPFKINLDRNELGRPDSLRHRVVSLVAAEQYDRAIQLLKDFVAEESEYPSYKEKSERYVRHSIDLVNAIRAKRNFPGAQYLTMSKQQELQARFREHYHELVNVLKKVEKIFLELKLKDIRSTVMVVRALTQSVFVILALAFFLELSHGLFWTGQVVIDDGLERALHWIFDRS